MARRKIGQRTLSSREQRDIFDRAARDVMRERERAAPKQKRTFFRGAFISKLPGSKFFTVSGTDTRFRTIGAAKAFIRSRG